MEIELSEAIFGHRAPAEEAGGGQRTVLIIEDNEKNRKLVRDVLQVKGYSLWIVLMRAAVLNSEFVRSA